MGLSALAIVLYTRASVQTLVVMYSINVFITFSLSQFGMVRHWIKTHEPHRLKKLSVNMTGLTVTIGILVVTSVIKFQEGGWITLLITGSLIAFCFWVHDHYMQTGRALAHLDEILTTFPLPEKAKVPGKSVNEPTAALLVNAYNGIGIHSFLAIHKSFPGHYKNFVFLSVGVLDSDRFKSVEEIDSFKTSIKTDLDKYVELANRLGFYAESHMLMETDVTEGLEMICDEVSRVWPKVTFFTGQLVFERETMWTRLLHNQTAFSLQRKLLFRGLEVVILPLRVRLSQLPA
jgi:K+ transporter